MTTISIVHCLTSRPNERQESIIAKADRLKPVVLTFPGTNKPADFGDITEDPAVVYQRWLSSREWFNATDIGKEIAPKIGAVKVNKILEAEKIIQRKDCGWAGTAKALKKGMVKEGTPANEYGRKPHVKLNKNLITIIQDVVIKNEK